MDVFKQAFGNPLRDGWYDTRFVPTAQITDTVEFDQDTVLQKLQSAACHSSQFPIEDQVGFTYYYSQNPREEYIRRR